MARLIASSFLSLVVSRLCLQFAAGAVRLGLMVFPLLMLNRDARLRGPALRDENTSSAATARLGDVLWVAGPLLGFSMLWPVTGSTSLV